MKFNKETILKSKLLNREIYNAVNFSGADSMYNTHQNKIYKPRSTVSRLLTMLYDNTSITPVHTMSLVNRSSQYDIHNTVTEYCRIIEGYDPLYKANRECIVTVNTIVVENLNSFRGWEPYEGYTLCKSLTVRAFVKNMYIKTGMPSSKDIADQIYIRKVSPHRFDILHVTDVYCNAGFTAEQRDLCHTLNLTTEEFNNYFYNCLIALIPAFFKELRDTIKPEVLTALKAYLESHKNCKPLLDALLGFITEEEIDDYGKQIITDIGTKMQTEKLNAHQSNRNDYLSELKELERRFLTLQTRLETTEKEIFYLVNKPAEGLEEDFEYIFNHPYVLNVNVMPESYSIDFEVRIPLSMWDIEEAEILLDNESYANYNNYEAETESFMGHVLVTQDVEYYVYGEFSLDLRDKSLHFVEHLKDYALDRYLKLLTNNEGGINGHIERYGCTGTHKIEMQKARQANDMVALFEAALNPYKNWNLSDGAVTEVMFETVIPLLIKHNVKCLKQGDNFITIKELYQQDKNKLEASLNGE